jgi:hypothetical protein
MKDSWGAWVLIIPTGDKLRIDKERLFSRNMLNLTLGIN